MVIPQKILLYTTADLPLIFPFVFAGILWGMHNDVLFGFSYLPGNTFSCDLYYAENNNFLVSV